ncbi:MAG: cation transporter [Eubacteriales bacterium]|nr:cation transporter [Eubacteriales bacterium]
MKKTFVLDELDCANCGLKMEDAIRKINGVQNVSISFMTQKLMLEAADDQFERVLSEAVKACKRVEPDCRIVH